MSQAHRYTAAEAAFVLREPLKSIKKALDQGPVQAALLHRSGASVRAIGWSDLFYLYAVRALRDELTPKARLEFYEALQREPVERGREVRFGRLRVAVSDLIDEMEQRTATLTALADKVEFSPDGEALLKDSRVEVYRIAALLDGGMSVDQILADYPSLSRDAVELARKYASAYPRSRGNGVWRWRRARSMSMMLAWQLPHRSTA
jgi:uncharacterized protein (DUF433 family)